MEFTSSLNNNYSHNTTAPSTLPRQKVSTAEKTEKWGIENLLYWESRLITSNRDIESEKVIMKKNSNLYFHNILDTLEVARIVNPHDIKGFSIPADFKHYKIENPKIQTLKGEELKRRFEWKVYVSNRDAVSKKEKEKQGKFFDFLKEQIQAESFSKEEIERKLKKLQEYLTYDWQDLRELTADQLLHHYVQYLDLKTEFSKIWEEALLYGEEIMDFDERNGKPYGEACDPKTMYWLKNPNSPYIDDSDAVTREYYIPMGKVIDYYYNDLTSSQISDLEELDRYRVQDKRFNYNQYYTKTDEGFLMPTSEVQDTLLNPKDLTMNAYNFSGWFDEEGNVRVVHTRWKSMRKVGELSYFDEQGEQQTKHVDENYKINKDLGETIKWIWISEAWEGTRIGENIFIKIKPRNVQFRKLDDISYCMLGYVGTKLPNAIYNIMKEYSIKYDAYMYRTEQALIKAVGKIGVLDLAMIPDDWDIDTWMHFAVNMGWAIKDSFKEAKKGAAMGKLAGQMGNDSSVINLEQGQFIQQNMQMLQYLEAQLDKLIGITPQRQGQVSADAGLQLTREAVQQSSNITESYFAIHDNVKMRSLRALLEVAKYCLKNKTESIQYITSEMVSQIFEVDGDLINEAEYGLLIGDARNDAKTIEILQEAVKIALQTGQVDLIQLMDIFSTDSTANIKRKIEKSVREKQEQEQQRFKEEQEVKKAEIAQEAELRREELADNDADRQVQIYKIDKEAEVKIEVATINSYIGQEELDQNNNGIPDPMELQKLALDRTKFQSDTFQKQMSEFNKVKQHQDKVKLEKEKISSKEKLEKLKIKQTEIQNKSQEKIAKDSNKLKEEELKIKRKALNKKPSK